jgi:hypothetical protein
VIPLVEQVREGQALVDGAVAFAKERQSTGYLDLYGRRIVDMSCAVIVAALLCDQAAANERKQVVAQRWLAAKIPEVRMGSALVRSGDETVITQFDVLAGRVAPAS